ncbi:MAG: metallophosphoesterase family protein [Chloroflexota bacterium]
MPEQGNQQGAHPNSVRIGVCTDTHYWLNYEKYLSEESHFPFQYEPEPLLRMLLAELEEAHLDMIFHLGDFICGGGAFHMERDAFYIALSFLSQQLLSLPTPVYALPGNHDCPPGGGDWAYFERLWGLHRGQGETIELDNATLILLNAQGHSPAQVEEASPVDPVYGWVCEEELARLDTALAAAGDTPVFLFLHQLLYPWTPEIGNQTWVDFYAVKNADAVLDVMAAHGNVRAVFQGHAHRLDVQTRAVGSCDCQFIILPSVVDYPAGWTLLELTDTHLHMQLMRLPVAELPRNALAIEGDESRPHQKLDADDWRGGKTAWQNLTIPL